MDISSLPIIFFLSMLSPGLPSLSTPFFDSFFFLCVAHT